MRQRRTPVLIDVMLGALLTVLSVATLADADASVSWFVFVLAVLAVAPLSLRQVAPVETLVVIEAALAAYALLGYGDSPSRAIGMVVAMFTVATLRPRAVAAVMYPTTLVVVLLSYLRIDDVTWAMFVQGALICLCAWALGDETRRWSQEAQVAAAAAERSLADERNRIARELHDVVSHHMSVVALQTGLAGYVLKSDPAAASTAMGHAGAASREALQDMGRMLGALRTDSDTPYQPQPGLQHLEPLVRRLRDGGLDVAVERSGAVRELSAAVELCAYRVVQESLTNVLKHAGSASVATVRLDYGDHVLTVEVVDDGPSVDPGSPGTGHGIRGMRERAELYGGVLEAGPRITGGFGVRLRLPVGQSVHQEVR